MSASVLAGLLEYFDHSANYPEKLVERDYFDPMQVALEIAERMPLAGVAVAPAQVLGARSVRSFAVKTKLFATVIVIRSIIRRASGIGTA